MSDFKTFKHMAESLRAGAAAGMNTQITLEPESAIGLAQILETYESVLTDNLEKAAHDALSEFFEKGGKPLGQIARELGI